MEDLKKALEQMIPPLRGETGVVPDDRRGGVCPHCLGRGVMIGPDDVAVRCSCMDVQMMNNRLKSARLSQGLMKCTLEAFDFSYYQPENKQWDGGEEHLINARKAWQAAGDFVKGVVQDSHHIGLMYSGPAGSGKTYLAAAMANELVRHNISVLFVVVPDLLDELRATYDRKDVSEYDLLDMAKTIPVLILDDLGAHNYTEWTVNRIYSILNYRVNESLPTIVTTNLHNDDIAKHLGERTSSRLVQLCRMFKLSAPQDIRMQQYSIREKAHKPG